MSGKVIEPKEICSGWDGYIDPQGRFYTSRRPGGGLGLLLGEGNITHEEWAYAYIDEKGISDEFNSAKNKYNDVYSAQDYLIYVLGWISYSHLDRVYITTPWQDYSPKITTAQKETLFKLCKLNNDDMNNYYEAVEEIEEINNGQIDYSVFNDDGLI